MAGADDLERLRAAAGDMDDLFELTLPDAPGMTFVGGRFGVSTRSGELAPFSAGAADEDPERAFRRCVGEMVETRAQFAAGRDFAWTRPDGAFVPGLSADEQDAIRQIVGADESGLWLPASRLADGASSSLPASLCLRDIAGVPSIATSLGCAAGRTVDEATLSALLELIERDALALWWRGGDGPGMIEADEIPEAAALLRLARRESSGRRTRFLDITSDVGVPVVAAVSFDEGGRSVAAGFAARRDRDAAACSALRELAQMELGNRLISMKLERGGIGALSDGEVRQLDRMRDLHADDPRFRARSKPPLTIDVSGADAAAVASRMAEIGIPAHRVDLTPRAGAIPVVKVVAPLLQSEPGDHVTPRLARMRELRGFPAGKVSSAGLI